LHHPALIHNDTIVLCQLYPTHAIHPDPYSKIHHRARRGLKQSTMRKAPVPNSQNLLPDQALTVKPYHGTVFAQHCATIAQRECRRPNYFKLNSSTLYLSLRDWFQAGSMHIAFCHPQLDAKPDTTQHHITSHQATHPLHSHPYVTKPNNQTNLPHTTNALLIPPPSHNKSQAPSRQPITLDH